MILKTVDRLGDVSEDVRKCIENEKDISKLEAVYKTAINVECLEQFKSK